MSLRNMRDLKPSLIEQGFKPSHRSLLCLLSAQYFKLVTTEPYSARGEKVLIHDDDDNSASHKSTVPDALLADSGVATFGDSQ